MAKRASDLTGSRVSESCTGPTLQTWLIGFLMMKGRDLVRSDRLIWWLLLVAAIIRAASIVDKGVLYDQRGFDDAVRYLDSARVLASTGVVSFAGVARSAYQMPGYAAFLSIFFRAPADQFVRILLIKVALLVVSVSSIYVLYLIGKRIGGLRVGLTAAALLTFSLPHVYTGNLTLSENPFMLGLLAMMWLVIHLADRPGWKPFVGLLIVFCITLYIKQAAVGFLLAAFVYLLVKRYPWTLLLKQTAVAFAVILLALAPWWIRNYQVFDTFVPFTSFDGAPFFEGTFQRFQPYGTGSFEAMARVLNPERGTETDRSRLLLDAGRRRLRTRWAADPGGVVLAYAVTKPAAAWLLPFYWDKVFGINGYWVLRIHAAVSALGLVLLGWFSVRSRSRAEFLLLSLNVLVITVGASYYLGLSRYVYPYVPFLYIAVAYLIDLLMSGFVAQRTSLPAQA